MHYGKIVRKEPVAAASRNLAQAAATAYAAYESLLECGMDVADASVAIENIQFTTDAITKNPDTLGAFIADGGLEAFIGSTNIESAEKATASLEGKFGDAMKNFWAKVKEWFARLGDWIRKFFYSLEGELKHLEGMVDAKNDSKFNPDAKFDDPMPTKQILDLMFDLEAAAHPIAVKILELGEKMKVPSPEEIGKLVKEGNATESEVLKLTGINMEEFKKLGSDLEALGDKLGKIGNDSEIGKNPPNNPIEAFAKVLKSGTASELGFKTAADVRTIVQKLAKSVRDGNTLMSKLTAVIKKAGDACNKYQQMADAAGLGDIMKCYRAYINLVNSGMNKYYSKFIRWELMLVTRVVRKMYSK